MKENNDDKIYIVKSESLLREEPLFSSKIIIILSSKTKLKFLEESKSENKDEIYNKVKLIKDNKNVNEYIGWIMHNQIYLYKPSLSFETKTKITETLFKYLNLKTAYSMEFPYRNGGFFDKLYEEKYYFDCSSFVTTILNRNFDFPPG